MSMYTREGTQDTYMEAACKTETSGKKTPSLELYSATQVQMGSLKLLGYFWKGIHVKCNILDKPSAKTLSKLHNMFTPSTIINMSKGDLQAHKALAF